MKKTIIGTIFAFALTLVLGSHTYADEVWDLTGDYTIDFVCTSGCSGTYTHEMNITTMDTVTGYFEGTGNYHPGTPTWTVVGNVSDDTVTFTINYDSSSYAVDVVGTLINDGAMSGTATGPGSQEFTWSTTAGLPEFQRYGEITKPGAAEEVSGMIDFEAFLLDNDEDHVSWAVRKGTCAAGTDTVFGNVDGFSDTYTWVKTGLYTYEFKSTADTSGWELGMYCFIFNPREDAGEAGIRLTREFDVVDVTAPIITWATPEDGETVSGTVTLKVTCNEDCDYINFWWRADGETFSSSSKRYHYVTDDGTEFEWGLDTLAAELWGGGTYVMEDGDYYLYAAGKDLSGNWARTPEIMISVDNTPDNKDQCKKGGWETWLNPTFRNQGDCVSWFQSNESAKGNKKDN